MKRSEPNALLALTTVTALALLICSAAVFGEPGNLFKYIAIAIVVPVAFIPLNRMWRKRIGMNNGPMITPNVSSATFFSAIFPAMITLAAFIPFFWPYKDYGILVLVGAVWAGLTIDSALIARKQ